MRTIEEIIKMKDDFEQAMDEFLLESGLSELKYVESMNGHFIVAILNDQLEDQNDNQ